MFKKKHYITFDTETTAPNSKEGSGLATPLIFDMSYAIHDKKGNILQTRAMVVHDLFCSPLLQHAFFAHHTEQYVERMAAGEYKLLKFDKILAIMFEDCKKYNVSTACAYNAAFDFRALKCTIKHLGMHPRSAYFLERLERLCIWQACADTVSLFSYITWATKHGKISKAKNIMSNAECMAQFYNIIGLNDNETHFGIDDVGIEVALLRECFRKKKKIRINKPGNWSSFQLRQLKTQWARNQIALAS